MYKKVGESFLKKKKKIRNIKKSLTEKKIQIKYVKSKILKNMNRR